MAEGNATVKPTGGDQNEHTLIPGDTPAQEGASMGEHCTTDRPAPSETPSGEISQISGIDVYITKPSDYPHLPSKLLILLSSGTGMRSQNNQLQADKYASEGFLVVMPDMFAGDSAPNTVTDPIPGSESTPTLIEKVKIGVAETAKAFRIDMWLARQTPEKVLPIIKKVIEGAKEEFADAVANGGGVYAVGYCFGGKYVLLLGSNLADATAEGQVIKDEEQGVVKAGPLIKAGALAHGTLITQEDLESVKAPIYLVCTENDQLFPDDIRLAGQKYLEEHGIEHKVAVYPDVPHGFAVVGEYDDPKISEAQRSAFEHMVEWLKAH
jgi:dienelactone hydrolase